MGAVIRFVNRLTELIAMLFFVIMVLVVFLQIVIRFIWGSSFVWMEEVARFLMIWIIFLGTAIAFRYRAHISIEFLYNRLSPPLKKAAQVLITFLCLLFILVLITKGWELSRQAMINVSPALNIPMGYVYFVIPISGILMIINLIDTLLRYMKAGQEQRGEALE